MTLKSLLFTALALGALTAGQAHAQYSEKGKSAACSLSVSQSYVPYGSPYSYNVSVADVLFSPLPPPSAMLYRVEFYGYNPNGAWIGPEAGPNELPLGGGALTGYYNPGGFTGTYMRYALVYRTSAYGNGAFVCSTNAVFVTLQ